MGLYEEIYEELDKLLKIKNSIIDIKQIQHKDGISLYRIIHDEKFYVLKYFQRKEYRREIRNYNIVKKLKIPTINLISYTDKSLLLEDIQKSDFYRLGIKEDLSDRQVATVLAKWYLNLHNKGSYYLKKYKKNLYKETDIITRENIELVKVKSKTLENNSWKILDKNYYKILEVINSLDKTLVYNDFYYSNLVVEKNKNTALMFDYNFLGIGYRYSDIRNVCSSLSKETANAFINEYGQVDKKEMIVDIVVSNLVTLILAYKKSKFPKWGEASLEYLKDGTLENNINMLI